MAIQNRRGNIVDFDPDKMLAGEFAYALDTEELYYCVAPGNVKRCATKEDVIEILETSQEAYDGLQQLLTELEDETVITGILNDISDLVIKSNQNENDIIKINNKYIGTNFVINRSEYYKSIKFTVGKSYLSPTGLSNLEAGDIITLSAYLSNVPNMGVALEVAFTDTGDASMGAITGDFVTTSGLYAFTFEVPQGVFGGDIFATLPHKTSINSELSIRNLKLELGSIVTPWKPSIYRLPRLEQDFNTHLAENANKHIHSSGSNDDGEWIRFDDGTQICWHRVYVGQRTALGNGTRDNPYRTNAPRWNYPIPFISPAEISLTPIIPSNNTLDRACTITCGSGSSSTHVLNVQAVMLTGSSTDIEVFVSMIAYGRYK